MAHCDHPHHDHAATGPATILSRAEQVCAERGLRLTPVRRRVLEQLAASPQPLGAYDLAAAGGEGGRLSAVSVYRALEFLEEAGLIHRLSTRPAYIVCCHDHHADEAIVFLVCETCGLVSEVTSARVAQDLAAVSSEAGFTPHRRALEIEGLCAACRASGAGRGGATA